MLEFKKKFDVTFTIIGVIVGILAILFTDYNWIISGFFGGFLASAFVLGKDFKHALKKLENPHQDVTLKKVYSNLLINLAIYAVVLIAFAFTPKYNFIVCALVAVVYRALLINMVGRLKG